jgi:type IVB pilus formation R64 PilN family outer membrane protein
MMRSTVLIIVPVLILATACTGLQEKIDTRVNEAQSRAERLVKDVGQVESTVKRPVSVSHEGGAWLGKNTVKLAPQDNLPPIFYDATTFDRTVHSLAELAERITLRSGIPTKVTPDAIVVSTNALMGNNIASPTIGGNPVGRMVAPPTVNGVPAPYNNGAAQSIAVRIVYPGGNLKGLLDTASARFGVFWKYVNGTIQLFYTDTRRFQINAIPGDSALTATVSSSSASGGGISSAGGATTVGTTSNNGTNSSTSQNTAVSSQLSVYSSIEKTITSMLTSYGKVVASPATGTITVTDTPDNLDRISQFVEDENKALARQVMINVTVLAVSVAKGDNVGINWNVVYGDLLRKFGIQNTMAVDPGSASFSAGILNTANSKWAGSSAVISALATQGQVRRETSASVVTLNNQPVPVQVAKQTSYLQSSQTTLSANVGSTTTLSPGVVTSGFNMTILPYVLNNGMVMLQFSTDISSLQRIRAVSSNNSTIESPELDTRNFLQRVAMKSNETLIISGFEQTDDNLDRQGVGQPGNFLFGGGYKAQAGKEIIVILITPVTLTGAQGER